MEDNVISRALDVGEQMLASGGEVQRVEDTIERILKAYGFETVEVSTITSEIQVTALDETGKSHTQLRRVHKWGTNLEKLEDLNQLSRYVCTEQPSDEEFKKELNKIEEKANPADPKLKKQKLLLAYAGAVITACTFAFYFGGNLYDLIATIPLAMLIAFMNQRTYFKTENQLVYYFGFALITGLAGNLLVWLGTLGGITLHLDKMLIGCVMLTIPGIAITYAVRDMILGQTITGLLRFIESLLVAASIASGFIISNMLVGLI